MRLYCFGCGRWENIAEKEPESSTSATRILVQLDFLALDTS